MRRGLVGASAEAFWAFLGVTARPEDASPAYFEYLRRLDHGVRGQLLDNAS